MRILVSAVMFAATAAVLAAPSHGQVPAGPGVTEAGFEVDGQTVRLAWKAPDAVVAGYLVEQRNLRGQFERLTALPIPATALDVSTSLLPDRTNVFRIVTVAAGTSPVPSENFTFRFVRPSRASLRLRGSDASLGAGIPGAAGQAREAIHPAVPPPPARPVGVQAFPVAVNPERPSQPWDGPREIRPIAPLPPVASLGSSAPPPAPVAGSRAVAPVSAPPPAPPVPPAKPKASTQGD